MANARWMWVELGCTVIVPSALLMFGTGWLGPTGALLVALAFPMGFAIASMVREGRPSGLAIVSLVSVGLTGGLGLLELDPRWFAMKEAMIPAVLGLALVLSSVTRYAVIPLLLSRVLDPERTQAALERTGQAAAFDVATRRATVELGTVMWGSAVGNFVLARLLVRSVSGTEAFAYELGQYTMWSFPAITVPVLVATLWVLQRVLRALEASTGVPLDDLLVTKA